MPDETRQDLNAKLQRLIETIDIANLLTAPLTESINSLLTISASEVNSEEASVLVSDGTDGDLRFLTAIGSVADQLVDMTIPAGKGIAGFVFSSGQPMAVADVVGEETFYAEVDRKTGYSTQTLLATPLRYDGEVIGVLEYVNRRGEPPYEPFTPEEMDKAAIYAEAVASLVNAYTSAKLVRDLGQKVISTDEDFEIEDVRSWLHSLRSSEEHRERMELAVMLREVAERGEAERQLCREILDALLKFSSRPDESNYLSF
jgi:signal transduction protein with GAF and PtsI domain